MSDEDLFALADDPLYRAPMIQIGATDVFTPAHVLGAALGGLDGARGGGGGAPVGGDRRSLDAAA